ncbi:MAG: cell division protein FtsL, partial [Paracoccaceae bacterium]
MKDRESIIGKSFLMKTTLATLALSACLLGLSSAAPKEKKDDQPREKTEQAQKPKKEEAKPKQNESSKKDRAAEKAKKKVEG